MRNFTWAAPGTLAEAGAAVSAIVAEAMAAPPSSGGGAFVKAGGIDLLDLMKEDLIRPARLVSLAAIPGLDTIAEDEAGGLRIGAMATLGAVAANALVRRRYEALAAALDGSASPEIRNRATIGGNLLQRPRCWYFRAAEYRCLRKGGGHCFAISGENRYHAIFDNHACAIVHPSTAATILVALGATLALAGPAGAARTLLLEEFLVPPDRDLQRENDLAPGEILTAIHLPPLPRAVMAHVRRAEKHAFDWPLADVGVVLVLSPEGFCERAAIVLGAVAPVPHRARAAEAALAGRRIDAAAAGEAARAALAGATPLAGNAYKLALIETLVRRALLEAAARADLSHQPPTE